ncbi:zf-HC2 domain-containing protein [Streptomyces antibioticus]|uniref:anti-sigma factor family protein n=1 Tax=Streptomyces TaxID=1883 RepID=UPI00158768F3|nr:zf-HC2 domain-containing protein [Streptomyces sp. CAI-85]NUV64019.1 hypothetical protein [Streptomyces sp. CAI-85]
MTSATDTTGHPDVDELSDLTEGLLTPSRSADVRQHLDGCEPCADVHASLEEIRDLLGALPEPDPMPDDIARRIDAALAAEAVDRAGTPTPAEAPDRSEPPAEAAPVSRETSTASGRETQPTADRPAGQARPSTTGPGRKDHPARRRGGRRKVAVLGAVLTVATLGLGSVLVASLTDSGGPTPSAHGGQTSAADSFSEGTLEQQVTDLLATAQGPRTSMGIQGEPGNASPRIKSEPVVPPCVQKGIERKGTERGDSAVVTDEGTYQGKDALLVVLPDASDTTRVTAYVMDATCVKDPSVGDADVLLKNSYTRR